MRNKLTLLEALQEYKIGYGLIEEVGGLPKGTIAQYVHGKRSPTFKRLKVIERTIQAIGEKMMNTKLIKQQ
jgi:hypothetical protein